jgi:UDP-N-acetylglucosamine 4-epimerase
VDNAVQANILAAITPDKDALNNIYNVALGDRTSLNELYIQLKKLIDKVTKISHSKLNYRDFREGDVRHSQADISKISDLLSFKPTHRINAGLAETVNWHFKRMKK